MRRRDAMKYRLAGASYRSIAEKLTEEQAQAYADEHGISIERAMKKITHVSVRTAWDDVTAEYEELRRETEVSRAELDGDGERQAGSGVLEGAVAVLEGRRAGWSVGGSGDGAACEAERSGRADEDRAHGPHRGAPGRHRAIDVNTLSEDTLRRVLRDEKREPLDVTRCR